MKTYSTNNGCIVLNSNNLSQNDCPDLDMGRNTVGAQLHENIISQMPRCTGLLSIFFFLPKEILVGGIIFSDELFALA